MSDHQAIYDAVRSRISNGDVGSAVKSAIHEANVGHYVHMALEEVAHAGRMQQRPCVLFRPEISLDGNMYMVLYGKDLMEGCAGFGETVAKAMEDFDKNWLNSVAPDPRGYTKVSE